MEDSRGQNAVNRANYNTWRKLGWWPGLVKAARGRSAGNRAVTTPGGSWGWCSGLVEAAMGWSAGNRAGYNTWRKLRW